ncbi:tetratricopeptide repeat protein [Labrenzia sp. VG12]|uniref:tetratricopeptide repeat protein n=1 Tax=Labrenzia sp. VG12 TaxID=2021862 RepID=UPI000B8BE0AA|nr:SEL1-like repeat protein [Labrenzia sp. VG12]ASP33714.1 hypothetical protein CHH27_11025 [Labrenzia sp. VG12]
MKSIGLAAFLVFFPVLSAHAVSGKDGGRELGRGELSLRQGLSAPGHFSRQSPGNIPDARELEKLLAREAAEDPEDLYRLGLAYESSALWKPDYQKAFSYFQRSEALGYPYAKAQLGYYYETGLAGVQDYKKAVSYYQEGADFGDSWAGLRLGYLYMDGNGVRKTDSQAYFWIDWASKGGVPEATAALGWLHENGIGTEIDMDRAARLYRKAGEEGAANAWVLLGLLHEHGELGQREPAKAAELYRKAAEQGNAMGKHHLGTMYYWGLGVEEDRTQAVSLFREAGEEGYARAHISLGLAYERGAGVDQDFANAADQYRQALEEERYPRALAYLAWLYQEGKGVTQDLTEARALYEEAAGEGDLFAKTELGLAYVNGSEMTGRDVDAGRRLLREAAEKDHSPAILALADMYERGVGVAADAVEAIRWYERGVALGEPEAMSSLGDFYENGNEVEQDFSRAFELYQKALDGGYQRALIDLGVLYTNDAWSGRDYDKARDYLEKAHGAEVDVAAMILGKAYFEGEWLDEDLTRARSYLQEASESGYWLASSYLGYLEEEGLGGPQDMESALRHYEAAASGDNLFAARRLMVIFSASDATSKNEAKALKWQIRAGELGDAAAAFAAAERLYDDPLHRDLGKASELYRIAADDGNLDASVKWARMQILGEVPGADYFAGIYELSEQAKEKPLSLLGAFSWMKGQAEETAYYSHQAKERDLFLGLAHLYGIVLPQDFEQAESYLRKVVEAKHHPDVAPFALAQVPIERGDSLPVVQGEIYPLLERSADRGILAAQLQLAQNFDYGYFSQPHYEKAAFWYRLAASHSDLAARRLAEISISNDVEGTDPQTALGMLESMTEAGDAKAAFSLATALSRRGEWQDLPQAAHYAEKAVRFGEADAYALLGWLHLNGGLEDGSWQKAYSYLTTGADAGNVYSMHTLGDSFAWGVIGARDLNKARRWLTKAADAGLSDAQASLGILLTSSAFLDEEDLKEGVEWLQAAARQNDAYAHYSLGVAALRGRGLERDPIGAKHYFQMTWQLDSAVGNVALGDYHYYGGEGKPDYTKAREHYLVAAGYGNHNGRLFAAWLFRYGIGVEADPARAADLLRTNSDEGDLPSMVELAKLYRDGVGVVRDRGKALDLLRKASRRGSAQAAAQIGWMTLKGLGVDQDVETGLKAIEEAAAQEVPDALYLQAKVLEEGVHLPQDLDRAIVLYKRAADYEIYPAFEALRRLNIDYQALGSGTPLKYRIMEN